MLNSSRISVTNSPNLDFSPANRATGPSLAEQLDAHADPRPHAVRVGVLEDQPELVEVLDRRE